DLQPVAGVDAAIFRLPWYDAERPEPQPEPAIEPEAVSGPYEESEPEDARAPVAERGPPEGGEAGDVQPASPTPDQPERERGQEDLRDFVTIQPAGPGARSAIWTDEALAYARKLRDEQKLDYSAIAGSLSTKFGATFTKDAVVGKLHREKVKDANMAGGS